MSVGPVNLDLFRLLVFVTVVDRNGYSAAARRLHLSQPTVSHHIGELERSCGGELLRYAAGSVHLTEAGQEVYRTAVAMLAEQDRLRATLDDLQHGRRGRVRLGASMAFEQEHFVGGVIAPFCRAHQGTLLSMRFGHSRREAQAVLDRELDLAYVLRWHLPTEAELDVLHEVELAFLAAGDHPLAAVDLVSAQDIAKAGLITAPLTGVESVFYRDVLRDFGLVGDHSVLEIEGFQARLLAAAAGCGVLATFVPRHGGAVVPDVLVSLRTEPIPPSATVDAGLVRRSDDPNVAAADLAEWLRDKTSA